MPAPLEQVLVSKCGLKYTEARQIVLAARSELQLQSRRSWNQALYDECLKRVAVVSKDEINETKESESPASSSPEVSKEEEKPKKRRSPGSKNKTGKPVNQARFQQPKRALAAVRTCSSSTLRSALSGLSAISCSSGESPSFFLKRDIQSRTKAEAPNSSVQKQSKQEDSKLKEESKPKQHQVNESKPKQEESKHIQPIREVKQRLASISKRLSGGVEFVDGKGVPRANSVAKKQELSSPMIREQEPLFPIHRTSSVVRLSPTYVPKASESAAFNVPSTSISKKKKKFRSRRLTADEDDEDETSTTTGHDYEDLSFTSTPTSITSSCYSLS